VDNRRVLLQEWLAEAVVMWGTAALIVVVTVAGGGDLIGWVYRVTAGLLLALALLTALTGGRTPVVWFKLCPVQLPTSAARPVVARIV